MKSGNPIPINKAKSKEVRHGLCASSFVVDNEDLGEYDQLIDSYMTRFCARDQVEVDLIDRMVHATWNQHRSWAIENELLNNQMLLMETQIAQDYKRIPPSGRLALAVS